MALGSLRKSDHAGKEQDIDNFISGAAQRTKSLVCSGQKYKRLTFSLTEEIDRQIDELIVKSQVARASRSAIIRAAIHQLGMLPEDELRAVMEQETDQLK